ncbi:MAG: hypothetical protein COA29_01665 [Porticoccus sp.]|nr:MAG: hypothetical protein COA29_01665 [Porticoccus sp.]
MFRTLEKSLYTAHHHLIAVELLRNSGCQPLRLCLEIQIDSLVLLFFKVVPVSQSGSAANQKSESRQ